MAKTVNFITKNKIEQYTDLVAHIDKITAVGEQVTDALKSLEKWLSDITILIKNITTHQKIKPVYNAEAKAFRAANSGHKLPHVAPLQSEYVKFSDLEEVLYVNYGKLKSKSRNITQYGGT